MATMIPDIDPGLIENSGEQRFYEAACKLPVEYTVYYSYKFSAGEQAERAMYGILTRDKTHLKE